MSLKDRKGTFTISKEQIEEDPEGVMRIMGACIVINASPTLANDGIWYEALSYKFENLSEGERPFNYSVTVDKEIVSFF